MSDHSDQAGYEPASPRFPWMPEPWPDQPRLRNEGPVTPLPGNTVTLDPETQASVGYVLHLMATGQVRS